jgi:hypothetical protein
MKCCEYGLSFTSKAGAFPSGAPYGEVPSKYSTFDVDFRFLFWLGWFSIINNSIIIYNNITN